MGFAARSLILVLLIVLCVVGGYVVQRGGKQGDRAAIASVNGVTIAYRDVKADPEIVKLACPVEMTESELAGAIDRQEKRKLVGRIRKVIFNKRTGELGLTASEEEINARVEQIFRDAGLTEEKAVEVRESLQLVREALMLWQQNPSESDVIYSEKLRDCGISKGQWRLFQACYGTPEKLKRLVAPKDLADMKTQSRESSKRDVLHKKLEDFIVRDISVEPAEIEKAYERKYEGIEKKPLLKEVWDQLSTELLLKKKQRAVELWWKEQYRQVKVEIKDPRFEDVLDVLQGEQTNQAKG
ncbi:MAG: hypothetical protein ACYTBJ_21355 [Planctomycetota bacterium]|jgi:hypothetical protein